MKTFQNRGEGFDAGKGLGWLLILDDGVDQAAELLNRRHMRRDVVDDEIVKIIDSKEGTQRIRAKKWRDLLMKEFVIITIIIIVSAIVNQIKQNRQERFHSDYKFSIFSRNTSENERNDSEELCEQIQFLLF